MLGKEGGDSIWSPGYCVFIFASVAMFFCFVLVCPPSEGALFLLDFERILYSIGMHPRDRNWKPHIAYCCILDRKGYSFGKGKSVHYRFQKIHNSMENTAGTVNRDTNKTQEKKQRGIIFRWN